MPDEYGALNCNGDLFSTRSFKLESGDVLPEVQVSNYVCYFPSPVNYDLFFNS